MYLILYYSILLMSQLQTLVIFKKNESCKRVSSNCDNVTVNVNGNCLKVIVIICGHHDRSS